MFLFYDLFIFLFTFRFTNEQWHELKQTRENLQRSMFKKNFEQKSIFFWLKFRFFLLKFHFLFYFRPPVVKPSLVKSFLNQEASCSERPPPPPISTLVDITAIEDSTGVVKSQKNGFYKPGNERQCCGIM